MGSWDTPVPGGVVVGASGRCRRREKKIAVIAMEITATPPTTPPTIAPVFDLLRPVDEEPERAEGASPAVTDTAEGN